MIILRDKSFSDKKENIGRKARNTGIIAAGTGAGMYALGKLGEKVGKGKSKYAESLAKKGPKAKTAGLILAGSGAILGTAGEIKRRRDKKKSHDNSKKED